MKLSTTFLTAILYFTQTCLSQQKSQEEQYRFLMLQVAKSAKNFKVLIEKSKSVIDQYVENINSTEKISSGPSDQEIAEFNKLWRDNLESIRVIRKETRKLKNARIKVELSTSLSNQLNMAVKLHQRFSLARLAFNRANTLKTWIETVDANSLSAGFDYEFSRNKENIEI